MKIFSVLPRRPPSRSEAWTYALLNQFATPGLGSLLARRWIAGSGQLLFAFAGFILLMGWLFQKMRLLYGQMFGTNLPQNAGHELGKWGAIIFMAAWFWSLVTSIQLLKCAKDNQASAIPPRIE